MGELDGRVFRTYEIIRELGHGGMAVVYLGRQTTMDRLVAIKVILSSYSREADFRARFDQEARTIAHLEHPHILPVIDYGEEDFGAYLVMRYVDGGTLETRLQSAPLPFEEAYDMLGKVASALDYAHGKGIVHRDLKPANILLDETGNPYLTDFGIAKILQATTQLTRTGATVGTPAYMAPEQWKSEPVGPYTDQYALGVVLYQMITGDLPFKADTTFGYMHKHIYERPEPPDLIHSGLPSAASEVILRGLAKDPAERYPTVRLLHEAFGAALYGEHAAPTKPAAAEGATVVGMEQGAFDSGIASLPATRRARGVGGAQALPEDATAALPGRLTPPPASVAARRGSGGLIALVALLTVILLSVIVFGGRALLGGPTSTSTPTATPPIEVAAAPTAAPTVVEEIMAAAPQEPSATSEPTEADTATATVIVTATVTDTSTPTATKTATVTASATETNTVTATPTLTPTATDTATATATSTETPTFTPTATWTPDAGATEDAALAATSQRVARELTATSSALIFELATQQAAQVGTKIAVSSFTPTATPTLTPTATMTSTLTPTRRPLPTITPRPAVILAAPTSTPYPTNTPEPVSCPGLLPSRLLVGEMGVVSDEDPRPVNLRSGPGLAATRIGQFPVGTAFTVLEGPVCQNNYAWFRVRENAPNGQSGWVAESGEGVYYLDPRSAGDACPGSLPSRLQVGAVALVDTPNGGPLRLRGEVGEAGRVIALIPEGVRLEMRAGPVCEAGRNWWQVRLADGRTGWVSETDADSYFLVPE